MPPSAPFEQLKGILQHVEREFVDGTSRVVLAWDITYQNIL
jgi:hypothetical protein